MIEESIQAVYAGESVVRAAFDRLHELYKYDLPKFYDELGTVPGINILMRNEEIPPGTDCVLFLFGKKTYDLLIWPASEPVEGAIAVYVDGLGQPCHVGRVIRNGRIISKLGETGHVYETPPYFSSSFGEPTYHKIPYPIRQYV